MGLNEVRHFFSAAERAAAKHPGLRPPEAVFLYGAGLIGREVAARLLQNGICVMAYIDDDPSRTGDMVDQIPVWSWEKVDAIKQSWIILTAPAKAQAKMEKVCRDAGATRIIRIQDFLRQYQSINAGLLEELETDGEALTALSKWNDDKSREIYRSLIRYRVMFDPADLPDPAAQQQYFRSEAFGNRELASFVDGGACWGDTLAEFRTVTGDVFDHYYAFEPQKSFYRRLRDENTGDIRVRAFNIALSDKPAVMRFWESADTRSHLSDKGGDTVEADSLDNVLAGSPVTMIKMDLEGAEEEALAGAENIIRKQRPALAICTYHKMEHLWRIPLWIARLNLGYRLMMMHHTATHSESVCYAVADLS